MTQTAHKGFTNGSKKYMHLYLQNIIDNISFENLPAKWQGFDLHAYLGQAGFIHFSKSQFDKSVGNGNNKIKDDCKKAGLPEPEFKEEFGGFSVYFYKDIYTEENLRKMGLNERQIKAVRYVKEKGKITNKEYQELCLISERTASRDLSNLVSLGVLIQIGETGRGTKYVLSHH